MKDFKFYIEGLGQRRAISDHKQIAWYFEQNSKTKPPELRKAYFLWLHKKYYEAFLEHECYELLAFLREKTKPNP